MNPPHGAPRSVPAFQYSRCTSIVRKPGASPEGGAMSTAATGHSPFPSRRIGEPGRGRRLSHGFRGLLSMDSSKTKIGTPLHPDSSYCPPAVCSFYDGVRGGPQGSRREWKFPACSWRESPLSQNRVCVASPCNRLEGVSVSYTFDPVTCYWRWVEVRSAIRSSKAVFKWSLSKRAS